MEHRAAGELAKISEAQRAALYDVLQTSLHNPDFVALAGLCGGKGFSVTPIPSSSVRATIESHRL